MTLPLSKHLLSLLAPPLAVCKYGCARCCVAPISVVWLAGLGAILYGFLGGPASVASTSWATVALGGILWFVAAIWAITVIKTSQDPHCESNHTIFCQTIQQHPDDDNPLNSVKKYY